MNKKWIFLITGLISLSLVIPTLAKSKVVKSKKEKKRFPYGCINVGHSFKNYVLVLEPTAKYHPQTVYLVHNLARHSVHVREIHTGKDPYIIHANTTIKPNFWAVLAMDHKKMNFLCTYNKKGERIEQVIDCGKVLELCEYPHSRYGDNHRGNYWFGQRSSKTSAKNAMRWHGVLLIDPKKVKRNKLEGNQQ